AIARGFAAAGAIVHINSRGRHRCEAACSELRTAGPHAAALPFDVADSRTQTETLRRIEEDHGGLDILVNNVGVRMRAPLEEISLVDLEQLLHINVGAAYALSKQAAASRRKRRRGRIIMMASIAGMLAKAGD